MAEKLHLRLGVSAGTQLNKSVLLGHVGVGDLIVSLHPMRFVVG